MEEDSNLTCVSDSNQLVATGENNAPAPEIVPEDYTAKESNFNNVSNVLPDLVGKHCETKSTECDACDVFEDARSLDLESLPVEECAGAGGSDSGVEGCGRALSSGGGTRSCASSVVSCGSACGSESSTGGARRRRVVAVVDPPPRRPLTTVSRAPNLATKERARSREKPVVPEKPRPLTPKPRLRPTPDLPNLVRESPALRAKPTKTSTARCTPSSPTDSVAARLTADKYGTLPRRRREDSTTSPKHEPAATPPSRRPIVSRSNSTRLSSKIRVRIYAEKTSQTILVGDDIQAALGGLMPNIDCRTDVTKCHKGVQASGRDTELARVSAAVARAEALAQEERNRRIRLEEQLTEERMARVAAHQELDRNSLKLLELAGAGASGGADECLRALEEQLRAARDLAAKQQNEIDALRKDCDKLHMESCAQRERARIAEERLLEAEREASEMNDFLAAETGTLNDALREAEVENNRLNAELEKRSSECRQLVRLCELRRQQSLQVAAQAKGCGGAKEALARLANALQAVLNKIQNNTSRPASCLPSPSIDRPRGSLILAVTKALRLQTDEDRSMDEEEDNSAELIDSETEPCLVTDPELGDEWWQSGEEISPVREDVYDTNSDPLSERDRDRDSLRSLSAAILARHRTESDHKATDLSDVVLLLERLVTQLVGHFTAHEYSNERLDAPDRSQNDILKNMVDYDQSKHIVDQYRQSVEMLQNQLVLHEDDIGLIEEEVSVCSEMERRDLYSALDGALTALSKSRSLSSWPRLAPIRSALEQLAFALAAPPRPNSSHGMMLSVTN